MAHPLPQRKPLRGTCRPRTCVLLATPRSPRSRCRPPPLPLPHTLLMRGELKAAVEAALASSGLEEWLVEGVVAALASCSSGLARPPADLPPLMG